MKSYALRIVTAICCVVALLAAVGGGGTWELLLAGVLWVVAFICAFLSMGSGDRLALRLRNAAADERVDPVALQ